MIEVTKLNKQGFVINCEWIETVEANPDTTITLTNGRKYIVRESVSDIVKKTIDYKRKANGLTGGLTGRLEEK